MKLKLLIAIAALQGCSGAWSSDVTYRCVVEHSLGVQLPEMKPVRFKTDYEYRIETVESYLEKTDGGKGADWNEFPEDQKRTLALRRTDKDQNDAWSWELLDDYSWDNGERMIYSMHFSLGETAVVFDAVAGRMSLAYTGGASLWAHGKGEPHSDHIDYTTCTAYFD